MRRKTVLIFAVCFTIAASGAAVLLIAPAERIAPLLYGRRDIDGIELKKIETNWILRKYEITGFPGEPREWLTRGHGEAPGQQVFYSFVDWALIHPDDFIRIAEGVEPGKREKLVYMVAAGVIDNLDEKEFADVFAHSEAPIVKEVSSRF